MTREEILNRLLGRAGSNLSFPGNISEFDSYIQFKFYPYSDYASNPENRASVTPRVVQLFVPPQPSQSLSADYSPDVLVVKSLVAGARSAVGNVRAGEYEAAANDVVGAGAAAIVRRVLDGISSEASGAISQSSGISVNPAMEYVFKNMNHRNFQFSFAMIPTTSEEAKASRDIVQAFKKAAAPGEGGSRSSLTGLPYFLKYPDIMIAEYKDPKKMHKFNPAVIKSVNATYNPLSSGTWTQHTDGYPTGIQLDIEFEEINIVTKELVDEDY